MVFEASADYSRGEQNEVTTCQVSIDQTLALLDAITIDKKDAACVVTGLNIPRR